MGRSTLAHLLVALAVLLGTAIEAQITTGPVGTWQFKTCAADIHQYFKALFPEYKIPNGRRLRAGVPRDDDVSEFSRRARLRFQLDHEGRKPSSNEETGSAIFENPVNGTRKGFASKFSFPKPIDAYLPPVGAWDKARMAASGCTSCANGCCDAVDISLDCGDMRAPLDYSSTAQNITLRVYRIRITAPSLIPANRKHVWLLQGGPGGSGLSIMFLAVPALQYASDIFIPDHRGTGRSTPLTCPLQQAGSSPSGASITASEILPCVNSGAFDFKKFTVTAAARDLDLMITSARTMFNPTQVFVHGYSYGTRWASRYLQLFPNSVDKVVLEGVVDKDTYFNDFAIGSQYAGTRVMQKCLMNDICKEFFSETSLASKINSISVDAGQNLCSVLWVGNDFSVENIRMGVQVLLYLGLQYGLDGPYKNPSTGAEEAIDFRTFVLGLVHRWSKCVNNKDNLKSFIAGLSFILSMSGGLIASQTPSPLPQTTAITSEELFNDIVYGMVQYSDLRRPMEDAATYQSTFGNIDWGQVETYETEVLLQTEWDKVKYPADAYMGNSPSNVQSKLLLVNGEIDGQTPRSGAYKHFGDITVTGSGSKTIAVINDMGHSATTFGCGQTVLKSFLESNTPDTSCAITAESNPIRPSETGFRIPERFSALLLGSPDSAFSGYNSNRYCQSPSAGDQEFCYRCFDDCLLQAMVDLEDPCVCAGKFSTCLSKAQTINHITVCKATLAQYSVALDYADFGQFGKCQASCASGYAGGGLSLALIVAVVVGCLVAVAIAGWVVVTMVKSFRKPAGGIVIDAAPANRPTTTAAVVAQVVSHAAM